MVAWRELTPPNRLGIAAGIIPAPPRYLANHAACNYEHMLQLPLWAAATAVPVLFGKSPRFTSLSEVTANEHNDTLSREIMRVWRIVQMAQEIGDLAQRFRPISFLDWAQKQCLRLPEELRQQAWRMGLPLKSFEFALKVRVRDLEARLVVVGNERASLQSRNVELGQRIAHLKAQVENLGVQRDKAIADAKVAEGAELNLPYGRPLGTRERENLQVIAAVCAVRGYGYDPAGRTSAVGKIVNDLENAGCRLSTDTVQKAISAGMEFFNPCWRAALGLKPNTAKP